MSRVSVRLSVAESGLRVNPADFKCRVSTLVDETLQSLQSIWNEAGYEDTECQGLLGDILTKLKAVCSSELSAEQQILEHAKNQVLAKLEEYHSLCQTLDREAPDDDTYFGENYADKLSQLERSISDIEIEISQRRDIIDTVHRKVVSLAEELGEDVPDDYDGHSQQCELSDSRLQLMETFYEQLEDVKRMRLSEMQELAGECLKCFNDLVVVKEGTDALVDSTEFKDVDHAVLSMSTSNEFVFGVHRNDLNRLIARLQSLLKEKDLRREELSRNGADIARMWTLLRIPSADREAFQSSFEMNLSMATLIKGREELARLKEIRIQSLGTVISTIREEISAYWRELGIISEEQQRMEFPLYMLSIEELEDSAVEEHESYCQEIKRKVEQLRPLLAKVAKRECIVEERIELEHLMQNPERLTARGPKAREDRKREEEMQRRVKNLDKITKELMGHIAAWQENNNGADFFYAGEKYEDRVTAQEEAYIETRNMLRNQRRKKDGKPEIAPTGSKLMKKYSSTAPSSLGTPSSDKVKRSNVQNIPSSSHVGSNNSTTPSTSNRLKSSVKSTMGRPPLTTSKCKVEKNSDRPESSITECSGKSQENQENVPQAVDLEGGDRSSLESDCSGESEYTSQTEVKERASTCTLIREAV